MQNSLIDNKSIIRISFSDRHGEEYYLQNFIKNDGVSNKSKSTERRGRPAKLICFDGKIYKGMRQLCEEYGLNPGTILNRLRAGLSLDEAINNRRKEIWYNGKVYNTIAQITTEYELSYDAVYAGLRKGKTLDEAMSTTLKGKKRKEEKLSKQQSPVIKEKIEFEGKKYVNLQQLAKDKSVHLGGVYLRISNGYTLEEAVELTKKLSRVVVYNGVKYKTLKKLALDLGIAYHILIMKRKTCSTIEEAVGSAIALRTNGHHGECYYR